MRTPSNGLVIPDPSKAGLETGLERSTSRHEGLAVGAGQFDGDLIDILE